MQTDDDSGFRRWLLKDPHPTRAARLFGAPNKADRHIVARSIGGIIPKLGLRSFTMATLAFIEIDKFLDRRTEWIIVLVDPD